jgi:hypothetical protein
MVCSLVSTPSLTASVIWFVPTGRIAVKIVQVNGLNIFYREAGPANGPVILLRSNVVSNVSTDVISSGTHTREQNVPGSERPTR